MKKRIYQLDLFRAIAIGLVVLCHLGRFLDDNYPFYHYVGVLGILIFFLLSGFLLCKKLVKIEDLNFKEIKKIWIRRWIRILPNYYLVLTFMIIIYSIFYYQSFNPYHLTYFVFLQSIFTPHQAFFGIACVLAVMEMFYILFPLLVLIISKLNKKYRLLISCIGVIVITNIVRLILWINNVSDLEKYVFLRFDFMAFGVLIYLFLYHIKYVFPTKKLTPSRKLITYISLISYSIYLSNYLIIAIILRFNLGIFIKVTLSLIIILILSSIQYKFYENKIRGVLNKRLEHKPKGL